MELSQWRQMGLLFLVVVLTVTLILTMRQLDNVSEPTCVTGTYYLPSPDGGFFTIDGLELCGTDMKLRDIPTVPSLQ